MSQYQMDTRFATTMPFLLALKIACLAFALVLWVGPLSAAPVAQARPEEGVHLLLSPLGETSVELLTHTVDVAVSMDAAGPLVMTVDAVYRLHNPTRTAVTLLLQIDTPGERADGAVRAPQNIRLGADNQPLALESTGNGLQQTAQLRLEPDQRRSLRLAYTISFVESELPAFIYPAAALNIWPGQVSSWRVTLALDPVTQGMYGPESWLAVDPDGWTHTGNRLQWLSEASFPDEPLRWQVIHPTISTRILARRQAISSQPTVADTSGLAQLYRHLYDQTGQDAAIQPRNRERFYALALSAYTDSLQLAEQAGSPPEEMGRLYHALAGLYRSRSVQPDGALDPVYVGLMVEEAETALTHLPAGAGEERDELYGWLADGLRIQTRQAQQRREWPTALALLERLAALPSSVVDQAAIDEERRSLLLEQALQFLEQDNQSAALTLIGSTLTIDDLLPTAERRAIFARWDFSVSVGPESLAVEGTGAAIDGREAEAQALVDALAAAWQTSQPAGGEARISFDGRVATVTVRGDSLPSRLALVQATPQNIHWSLLRTLLVNSDAEYSSDYRLLWRRVSIVHSLDLRPVADQWRGMAAGLDRDSLTPGGAPSPAGDVRGQLQAILYRQAGDEWQRLARDSRVRIALSPDDDFESAQSRVWNLSLSDAPQSMRLYSESLSLARFLLALVLAMALIFGLAGILWLLL